MKVLILYTAHTLGHKQIAENLAYWIRKGGAEVTLEEVLKSNPKASVKTYLRLHAWVNKRAPWFWGFMYRWGFWLAMPFRLWAGKKFLLQVELLLAAKKPDVVITTQTTPSSVMCLLSGKKFFGRWYIAFSDFHFHRFWMYKGATGYLVNTDEQTEELVKLGVERRSILRFGMGLYELAVRERSVVRNELEADASTKLILVNVGGGTLHLGLDEKVFLALELVVKRAAQSGKAVKVVFACGRDEELRKHIAQRYRGKDQFLPLPFYTPFRELIAAADLALGKAGGLTTAECIFEGVPVGVYSFLPGQELLNLRYLENRSLVHNWTKENPEQLAAQIFSATFESPSATLNLNSGKPLVSQDLSTSLLPFLKGESSSSTRE